MSWANLQASAGALLQIAFHLPDLWTFKYCPLLLSAVCVLHPCETLIYDAASIFSLTLHGSCLLDPSFSGARVLPSFPWTHRTHRTVSVIYPHQLSFKTTHAYPSKYQRLSTKFFQQLRMRAVDENNGSWYPEQVTKSSPATDYLGNLNKVLSKPQAPHAEIGMKLTCLSSCKEWMG